MSVDILRRQMIELYQEMRPPESFLSGKFLVRPGNISDTEEVTLDIERWDEEISPVTVVCTGPTFNTLDQFTTKTFTPPTIDEAMPFSCASLLKRRPGTNEYDATNVQFQAQLVQDILKGMLKLSGKMSRNREWQAAQIFADGKLNLKDEAGNVNYSIDYAPKVSHFTTAGATWQNAGSDVLGDIDEVADVIRDDSKQDADLLIMGETAFEGFMKNTVVLQRFDNRRYEQGGMVAGANMGGAKRQGKISIGSYSYEVYTYNGRGIVPGDSTATRYVDKNHCLVQASSGRLDTVYAGVPVPQTVDPRFAGLLPPRVSVPQAIDVSPHVYCTQNSRETILEMMSRPLLIPTAIDSFGRIDAT